MVRTECDLCRQILTGIEKPDLLSGAVKQRDPTTTGTPGPNRCSQRSVFIYSSILDIGPILAWRLSGNAIHEGPIRRKHVDPVVPIVDDEIAVIKCRRGVPRTQVALIVHIMHLSGRRCAGHYEKEQEQHCMTLL